MTSVCDSMPTRARSVYPSAGVAGYPESLMDVTAQALDAVRKTHVYRSLPLDALSD